MTNSGTRLYALFIIGMLFFVFGFITWVNGVLIPYFQICLELTNFQSLWVAFAAYIAYFVMAIPSAYILKQTGYKKGMVIGLIVMAAGTLLFLPAAYMRTYGLFLTGLFITGTGLALLQTAANPYIAIIGPPESTAQRIGFMGVANKTAGILSQQLLGALFLFDADNIIGKVSAASEAEKAEILDNYVLKVVDPYLVITGVLLLLAVGVRFSRLPEVKETSGEDTGTDSGEEKSSVLGYPYLVLGVLALFMASACEVIPIDCIIVYSRALGIPLETARHFTEYTLYAMLAGYVLSTVVIPKFISQQKALRWVSIGGVALSIGAATTEGMVSVSFIIAMGFGSALLWGTIWGLAVRDLGPFTKIGAALLLMSVVGGGLFPLLFGGLTDLYPERPQLAVTVLIPCYLFLIYYATWGYRLRSWSSRQLVAPSGSAR